MADTVPEGAARFSTTTFTFASPRFSAGGAEAAGRWVVNAARAARPTEVGGASGREGAGTPCARANSGDQIGMMRVERPEGVVVDRDDKRESPPDPDATDPPNTTRAKNSTRMRSADIVFAWRFFALTNASRMESSVRKWIVKFTAVDPRVWCPRCAG